MELKTSNASEESIRPLSEGIEEAAETIISHINKNKMEKMLYKMTGEKISSKEEQIKIHAMIIRFIENVQFVSATRIYPKEIAKALIINDNKNLSYLMKFWVDKKGIILKNLDGPVATGDINQDAENFKCGLKEFLDSIEH